MENKPKTKKECFDQLDKMLSETDKKAIAEAKDIIEFHFTLGLCIRNNWLYDRSEKELESLSKAFGIDESYFWKGYGTWHDSRVVSRYRDASSCFL